MKVFTLNSKMLDNRPVLQNATLNLSVDELQLIKYSLETSKKSSNDVLESQRENLLFNLENLMK